MMKLRIDRYALAEIASDKAVLEALLQTTFAINGTHDTSRLLEGLLERIFTLIPSERGAVFFAGRKPETLDCVVFRNSPPYVNRDIAMEAMSEFTATVSGDGTSLLCVPLLVFQSVLGVIYLDSSKPDVFTRTHLHLLIGISSITAVSLEHTRYIERLESENQRLHEEIAQEHSANLEIIGDSPRMHRVLCDDARGGSTNEMSQNAFLKSAALEPAPRTISTAVSIMLPYLQFLQCQGFVA